MPFIATATFPAKVGQIIERDRRPGIADSSPFIAARAEQRNLTKFLRFIIPAAMGCVDDFTVVAPGIRKWAIFDRFIPIEAKPRSFSEKVRTDKRLKAFAMSSTLNFVCHCTNMVREERKSVNEKISGAG